MITIKIGKKNGMFRAVSDGHAEFNPGNDPVCAGVSAIMYTLMGSVENLTKAGKKRYRVENGAFDIRYQPNSTSDELTATVLYNAAIIGLLQIKQQYPEYIRFEK